MLSASWSLSRVRKVLIGGVAALAMAGCAHYHRSHEAPKHVPPCVLAATGAGGCSGGTCTKGASACAVVGSKRSPDRTDVIYPRRGELTEHEKKMLRIAWVYFQNNYQPETGLTNAVNDYPSVTLWDTASYLGGLVTAYENDIVDANEFNTRLNAMWKTLNTMELFRGEVPNKVYNTKTAAKVDYGNQPGEIGFSALDAGRFLIWLKIIKERYPEHRNAIDQSILRWTFCNMIDEQGTMFGAIIGPDKKTQYLQEGRLGYEEYAAKGFQLWGFDTTLASKPEPYEWITTYGVRLPHDTRDPRTLGAHNYVVAESYVLDAIELNWDQPLDQTSDDEEHTDPISAEFAQKIYHAQVARYDATGILTARTEHQLDGPPYFVYDTIYTDGYAWNTITEDGKHVPQFAAIALKGALGMWAVWDTPYTDLLFKAISNAYDPKKGFYEGIYENGKGPIKTWTANNNGIMMETLLFKQQGKLLKWGNSEPGLWERVISNPFMWERHGGKRKCLPKTFDPCKNCAVFKR